jgi:hypothetical protein
VARVRKRSVADACSSALALHVLRTVHVAPRASALARRPLGGNVVGRSFSSIPPRAGSRDRPGRLQRLITFGAAPNDGGGHDGSPVAMRFGTRGHAVAGFDLPPCLRRARVEIDVALWTSRSVKAISGPTWQGSRTQGALCPRRPPAPFMGKQDPARKASPRWRSSSRCTPN